MPKQTLVSLQGGLVILDINTAGANLNTFVVTNNDPALAAIFRVFDAQNNVIWSFTQPKASTSAATPIPTVDNFGNPITWVLGQQTLHGSTIQTIVSPPWQLTMEG
jgi:hypothetical protein